MINKDGVRNILITRTDRLGDVILTLPLITATSKFFDKPIIYFFVKEYLKELIENYDGIEELLIEEEADTFSKKYKLFKSKELDLVINVKPRFDLALIFFLLGVKYRIGTGYRWYSFLYNCKVYEHRKDSIKHESEYNLNLLRRFVDEPVTEGEFQFRYSKEEKDKLDDKLGKYELKLKDKFIIVHPGSGGSSKDLPGIKFSEYIKKFSENYPEYKIVLTGLKNEKSLLKSIISMVGESAAKSVIDLSGDLNLRELMIITDNSKLFIANSTGPVHIAGALNKNIIGLYPNEKVMSETRWKPLGKNVRILKPESGTDDMNSIKSDEILDLTKIFLNKFRNSFE